MPVRDDITGELFDRLLEAKLPGSAFQVFVFLYRRSILEGKGFTHEIPVREIAQRLGVGKTTVRDGIKALVEEGWLAKPVRPKNLGCEYEVRLPNSGSVWDFLKKTNFRSRYKRKLYNKPTKPS